MKIKDKNLYYVGGVVRDEILGIQSLDTDFCYEGNAIEFSKKFNVVKTNPDFGTVRIVDSDGEIDIASTRTENYPKAGHLPVVDKIGCTLKEDLQRRDFTINAMAKNTETNEIIDYFGGKQDLEQKVLRVLHDQSFIDDPTRIIRGLKFSIRFGLELEEHTKKLQEQYLENINYDISYHRLKKELKETFNLNKEEAYSRFIEQNLYKLLGENQEVPELKGSISNLINKCNSKHIWIVYLGLFNLSNFNLTNEEISILDEYRKIKSYTSKNDFETFKLFKSLPIETVILYGLQVDYKIVIKFLEEFADIELETTGQDLIDLGISQGKIFSEIFDFLLEEKFKNPDISKKEELELVKSKYLC